MPPITEVHPFENFVPDNATHLILGTFPTLKKNWRFNFNYPGRNNFFWRLLSDIYKHSFKYVSGEEAAAERAGFCTVHGIALSDTVYSCKRKVSGSSKDSDLIIVKKMDVVRILRDHPGIHSIILTGSSGSVSAHRVFFQHLDENQIPYKIRESLPPVSGSFVLGNRKIKTHTVYSTSGINIGRYHEALRQFRKYLPPAA